MVNDLITVLTFVNPSTECPIKHIDEWLHERVQGAPGPPYSIVLSAAGSEALEDLTVMFPSLPVSGHLSW